MASSPLAVKEIGVGLRPLILDAQPSAHGPHDKARKGDQSSEHQEVHARNLAHSWGHCS